MAALCLAGLPVIAQTSEARRFDIASVKASAPIGGGIHTEQKYLPREVTLYGITPRELILRAFSLKPYQLSGPSWMGELHLDIVAKCSEPAQDAAQRAMLRQLLSQRFQMKSHIETRALPIYELRPGKAGLKIRPVQPDNIGTRVWRSRGVKVEQATMDQFAALLSQQLERPVLDRTGAAGVFNIDVAWTPLAATPEDEVSSSSATSLKELGLRLVRTKSAISMLVIDNISRPTPN